MKEAAGLKVGGCQNRDLGEAQQPGNAVTAGVSGLLPVVRATPAGARGVFQRRRNRSQCPWLLLERKCHSSWASLQMLEAAGAEHPLAATFHWGPFSTTSIKSHSMSCGPGTGLGPASHR